MEAMLNMLPHDAASTVFDQGIELPELIHMQSGDDDDDDSGLPILKCPVWTL